jgi:hypothetical protein
MIRVYGRHMARSTLNEHLDFFVAHGYLRRKRRHHRDPLRGFVFSSSLYILTKKAKGFFKGWNIPTRANDIARAVLSSVGRVRNFKQYGSTSIQIKPKESGKAPPEPPKAASTTKRSEALAGLRNLLRS